MRSPEATSDLLTSTEVAAMLRVGRTTVNRWAREGLVPAIRLPSSQRVILRFRREDIEALLDIEPTEAAS